MIAIDCAQVVHVEKKVPYKVEVPVEKIVHVPFEKIVEKFVNVPYDRWVVDIYRFSKTSNVPFPLQTVSSRENCRKKGSIRCQGICHGAS